jgi:tRNA(Ile)-lysidine synthase
VVDSFLEKMTRAWPPERWKDVTVLAAVSGGADSVALLRALLQIRSRGAGQIVVAHFNHRLRGEESDLDQACVERLSQELGVRCVVGQADEKLGGRREGQGFEGAARQARYEFLASAAGQSGARYIATAHTADDQVETILHNIIRGTGLAGIAGIPRFRRLTEQATLVRPLLDVQRMEILEYLKALRQPFRNDATNQLAEYTRNRIRLELLPILEREFNPKVREALLRLAQIAGQTDEFLDQGAEQLLSGASRRINDGVEIEIARLAGVHPALARQALALAWQQQGWPLQDMSFEKWEELLTFARGDSSSEGKRTRCQMFPGGVTAEVEEGLMHLTRPV